MSKYKPIEDKLKEYYQYRAKLLILNSKISSWEREKTIWEQVYNEISDKCEKKEEAHRNIDYVNEQLYEYYENELSIKRNIERISKVIYNTLNEQEIKIIEEVYSNSDNLRISEILEKLKISRDIYYKKKGEILEKLLKELTRTKENRIKIQPYEKISVVK